MIPEQTLTKEDHGSSAVKPYVLEDDGGLFISFSTAQEAFAWIELYTPAAITVVNIQGNRTLTEGRIIHKLQHDEPKWFGRMPTDKELNED